jgi:hypothetical protein
MMIRDPIKGWFVLDHTDLENRNYIIKKKKKKEKNNICIIHLTKEMLRQYLYDVHRNHKIVLRLFQCHVMQLK